MFHMFLPKDNDQPSLLQHLFCYDLYSQEMRRHLLLGRKSVANLDIILRNRGIPLPTKVHIVKAMTFQVVMYSCESWTIKKAEGQKINAFKP